MHLKRTGILTKIVITVLLIYGVVSLVWINSKNARAREELEKERVVEAQLSAETDKYERWLNNSDDPEVMEEIAREMGLEYPNTEIYS